MSRLARATRALVAVLCSVTCTMVANAAAATAAADPSVIRSGQSRSELMDPAAPAGSTPDARASSFAEAVARGDAAWRQGQADLAVYFFVQALGFDPRHAETLAKIGSIHESRGNLPLARRAFEMAAERAPDDARITERLGLLCLRQRDELAARRWLERARASAPARLRTAEALGSLALRRGDAREALALYGEVLAREPAALAALSGRAAAAIALGDDATAEADLQRAIQLIGAAAGSGSEANGAAASDLAGARRLYGQLLARRGQYADGLAQLLMIGPEHEAWNQLGEAAIARRDYANAQRHFEKALSTSPSHYVEASRNLTVVRERIAADDGPRAEAARGAGPALPPARPTSNVAAATHRVAVDVRVRSIGDVAGRIVGYLGPGDQVRMLEQQPAWLRVEFRHRASGRVETGWISAQYLRPLP